MTGCYPLICACSLDLKVVTKLGGRVVDSEQGLYRILWGLTGLFCWRSLDLKDIKAVTKLGGTAGDSERGLYWIL